MSSWKELVNHCLPSALENQHCTEPFLQQIKPQCTKSTKGKSCFQLWGGSIRFLGQKWRQLLSGICWSLRKALNFLISPVCFIKTNSKFFWTDKPGLKTLYWVKKHICLLTEKHQHEKIKLFDYLCCFLGSSSPSGVTDKCCVIFGEGTKFPFLDFGIQEFLKKICFKMRKNICEWCKKVPLKHKKIAGKKALPKTEAFLKYTFLTSGKNYQKKCWAWENQNC